MRGRWIKHYCVSKRFILYPGVGISNGIAIKNENKRVIEIQSYNNTDISEGNVVPFTKNYEQGWLFGAGCAYTNFNVEFRYELATGMSDSSGVGSSVNRYFVLFEYRF